MRSSITIATDLTARSDRPMDRAVQLAQQFDAKLIIVHALEAQQGVGRQRQMDSARQELTRITSNLKISFDLVLAFGSAPELIAEVAEKQHSRLIVVGAARYNHVSDFFLGTAVDYLIRNATVPVLVVKERPLAAYDGLIAGTDFSERARDALINAMTLFDRLPATLVHAFDSPFPSHLGPEISLELGNARSQAAMEAFLAQPDIAPFRGRISAHCSQGNPAAVIAAIPARYRQALAIFGSHGWGPLAHAVLGSRVSGLITDIPHDVMIVREGIY